MIKHLHIVLDNSQEAHANNNDKARNIEAIINKLLPRTNLGITEVNGKHVITPLELVLAGGDSNGFPLTVKMSMLNHTPGYTLEKLFENQKSEVSYIVQQIYENDSNLTVIQNELLARLKTIDLRQRYIKEINNSPTIN